MKLKYKDDQKSVAIEQVGHWFWKRWRYSAEVSGRKIEGIKPTYSDAFNAVISFITE